MVSSHGGGTGRDGRVRRLAPALVALALVIAALTVGAASASADIPVCTGDTCGTSGGPTPNAHPTAAFTSSPASPVARGTTVGFDGSGSEDPDGSVAGYSWNFGDGSAVDTTSGATPTHTYAAVGTYTVTLTVTDNQGANSLTPASHTVTVVAGATVSYQNGVLSYTADPGTASNLTGSYTQGHGYCAYGLFDCYEYGWSPGSVTMTDSSLPLAPGPGCSTGADAHSVTCSLGAPFVCSGLWGGPCGSDPTVPIQVSAGDGNDQIDLSGLPNWPADIDPGTGTNTVTGVTGTQNTIDLSGRSTPVTVNLAGGTATATGESDTLHGIQDVIGGSGNDVLTGDSHANTIDGGAGNDTITGGGGTDTVDYSRRTAAVTVTLNGGSGTGGQAGETDTLSGIANVIGGSGDDTITTSDSSANHVACGGGTDTVYPDADDSQDGDCEHVAPTTSSKPSLSGTLEDGQTLTATIGNWHGTPGPTETEQWYRCDSADTCAPITGANSTTYQLGHDDVDHQLYLEVTASNGVGPDVNVSSDKTTAIQAAPPVNQTLPTIAGTAEDEHTLSVNVAGTWNGTPPTLTYQWQRCAADGTGCADVPSATGMTYPLHPQDIDHTIRVAEIATNEAAPSGVRAYSSPSDVVQTAPPMATVKPGISGTPVQGSALAASPGTWTGTNPTYAYQWRRCDAAGNGCSDISGATGGSYALGTDDVGHRLRVRVTATNAAAPAGVVSDSDPTAVIAAPPAPPSQGSSGPGTPSQGSSQTAASSSLSLVLHPGRARLGALRRSGLKVAVTCSAACRVTLKLVLDRRTAKRLRLSKGRAIVVSSVSGNVAGGAPHTLTLRLPGRIARALGRLSRLGLSLQASATGGGLTATPVTRGLSFRR